MNGTGLGLATVKNIIEMHNGSITVDTDPTRFTIKIPKY
jgi:signal transduction histidine kinase